MTTHQGKGVCPGITFGKVHLLQNAEEIMESVSAGNAEQEWERFLNAKAQADRQLEALFEKAKQSIGEEEAMIIDVQRMMLDDGDYNETIESMIKEIHVSAPYAVAQAGQQFSAFFSSLEDPYMKARSTDVNDVSQRLVDTLLGRHKNYNFTEPAIVVAEDLTPSETLQMEKSQIRAFVIRKGSGNSHTAILARTMNIPCVVQADIRLDPKINGKEMIVDGERGVCYLNPSDDIRSDMLDRQKKEIVRMELLENMRGLPTVTKSGRTIRLFSNIGSDKDIDSVLANDSEGVGLFRSEFLYLGRKDFPTEDEQFAAYRKVAEGMGGKQVIIRTLDIGADKKAEYFRLDEEENPALGLRGVRICIDRPDVFRTQLRAIYRASAFGNIAVMFPMITSIWEVLHCRDIAADVCRELAEEGIEVGDVEIGIMIETPAAAISADALAKEVDFFSVGTNDLTQYTLAIDRQNSKLERFYDPHHPAIMEMLSMIARAARSNGIWAGICGELAADLTVTEALVKMGFDELSVSPSDTLELREKIREID